MADSASIGASFSDYQGNPQLGNVGLGVFDIDTRPLAQLAQYTFFYKKNLWEQKQKETDAKVAELADLSNISLNDLRGKDKEYMTGKFSTLLEKAAEFARKDPKTAQEKIQNELEWQTEYGAFKNNYGSGKGRAVSYYARINWIKENITDATTQDEAIRQLNKEFDDTDIATQITATPNFKIEKFDIPEPVQQKFTSIAVMGNDNLKMKNGIYNPRINGGIADASLFAIGKAYPKKGTPEYDKLSPNEKNQADLQATIPSDGKGYVDATDILNKALQPYIKDEKFDAETFERENFSNTVLMKSYNAAKLFNEKMHDNYNQALNGYFTNKGINIPLPPNINPNDFKYGFVDFTKVTPNNVMQSGMYAKYTGDTFDPELQHTGEANDLLKARLIQSGENYRKSLDLIGKGWVRDAKGKLQPPKANATTAAGNGGIVPYWQNYITPQIEPVTKFLAKSLGLPINQLNGDIDIKASDVSGLGVALFGEAGVGGHHKAIIGEDIVETDDRDNKTVKATATKLKIRFVNGSPIGVVIDGVFYDQNDVNTKATQMENKSVSNKFDNRILDENGIEVIQPNIQTQSGSTQTKITDYQKFIQGIK